MRQFISSKKIPLLFIFAFLIRLINLNQSLWLDEATTAIAVKTHSFIQIITQFSPADFHPPLYYLFMDLWTNVFGYSEIALRMPSVIFSLGTGWMIYLIIKDIHGFFGRRLSQNDTVGFWATAFFLFNPLIIYYSQEARMYSMATFFIAVSFYFFVRVMKHEKCNRRHSTIRSDFLLLNIFLILSFYTFYASIFYIATVYLYLLWTQKHKGRILMSGIVVALGIAAILPLVFDQYTNSRLALESVTNWSLVLGNVSVKNILLIPIKFTSGRISFEPKMLYYALAGGWMAFLTFPIILNLFRRLEGLFGMTLFFFITPLILGTIFSLNSPLLQYFRFQYLILFLSIILGISCCHSEQSEESRKGMDPSHSFRMTRYIVLIGFISWSLVYLFLPQFHREDWKSLLQELRLQNMPIYMISSSSDPLKYYAPELQVGDVRMINGTATGSFIIIPYTADIHGVEYQKSLSKSYSLKSTYSVRGLIYEVWSR